MPDIKALTAIAADRLAAVADADKAVAMAAYMKTDMAFYGVQKAGRTPVMREIGRDFPPATNEEYREAVRALWALPHREEKYLALGYARKFGDYVTGRNLDLYRRLITEGAWWDLVDETAVHLVGHVLRGRRDRTSSTIRSWNEDPDLWLRRTSIICQVGHKEDTDRQLLFAVCTPRLEEKDFFIRKAIGWALRDYAKTDPAAVRGYVTAHRAAMSGLSYREATKHL